MCSISNSWLQCFHAVALVAGRASASACKKMGGWWRWALFSMDGGVPSGWSVCLPLLIFPCTIKSRSSLLAPAHPGGPGKRAVKWLWCVSAWHWLTLSFCLNHAYSPELTFWSTANRPNLFVLRDKNWTVPHSLPSPKSISESLATYYNAQTVLTD